MHSLEAVFNIIRSQGPLYPKDITLKTGLVKSTVSQALGKLLVKGIVEEEPGAHKRKRYRIYEDYGSVIGIYAGLTSIHFALCDLSMNIIERAELQLDFNTTHPQDFMQVILNTIQEWVDPNLLGIGIGLPRAIDFQHQVCLSPLKMPEWNNFSIVDHLGRQCGCPVLLDNDVNVLALGEQEKGFGKNISDFIYVKIGTGIGAGIILGHRIFRGSLGAAGDIGHIKIAGNDTLCLCGNRGCFEMAAGARGIQEKALLHYKNSPFLQNYPPEFVDTELVSKGFAAGDLVCTEIVIDTGRLIGSVLAGIVNTLNPALIVIGGGVSQIGYKLLSSIQEALYQQSQALTVKNLIVKHSLLLDEGGTIGAAVLIREHMLNVIMTDLLA